MIHIELGKMDNYSGLSYTTKDGSQGEIIKGLGSGYFLVDVFHVSDHGILHVDDMEFIE